MTYSEKNMAVMIVFILNKELLKVSLIFFNNIWMNTKNYTPGTDDVIKAS